MGEIMSLSFVIFLGLYCVIFTRNAAKMIALFLEEISKLNKANSRSLEALANENAVRALGILNLILAIVLYGRLE